MVDPILSSRLAYRLLYVGLATLILFLQLVPLQTVPRGWAAPDFLVGLTFAWVLRRPDYVPALLIAGVALTADLLLQRPPGLHAALVLIGAEFLRSRMVLNRDLPFLVEWALVAAVVLGLALAERLVLAGLFVPTPRLGLTFIQALTTIAAYPLAVLASTHLLGIRKLARGDVDSKGRLV
ncbi:rod shape-determining protein MreD [Pseudoruegeria sp. SHC-113]|uniref:rod shape-determining protein MreD n=1 Tax=Pseudoruegeria sp. SHC-113 TaxID=2855439 RepID=UPI0021BB80EF|nr:rod shape-determining protein MreD [Pseudoruegeria sp. SHC-113]MCT8161097.1 rod shape-determining protein MreD [Pseudoruegeria sp. SHC-113]